MDTPFRSIFVNDNTYVKVSDEAHEAFLWEMLKAADLENIFPEEYVQDEDDKFTFTCTCYDKVDVDMQRRLHEVAEEASKLYGGTVRLEVFRNPIHINDWDK